MSQSGYHSDGVNFILRRVQASMMAYQVHQQSSREIFCKSGCFGVLYSDWLLMDNFQVPSSFARMELEGMSAQDHGPLSGSRK